METTWPAKPTIFTIRPFFRKTLLHKKKKKNQKQGGSFSRTYRHVRKIPKQRYVHSCMLSHFSHILLFVTLWTVARQAPLSIGFFRQEYWSGLPCPPLGDLPNQGIEPSALMCPASAGSLPLAPPGKPKSEKRGCDFPSRNRSDSACSITASPLVP